MKKTIIASLIGAAFATPTFAADSVDLDNVVVKANRFEHKDTETTYAAEIHTAEEISASGAATLYDFLAQQTTLNVQPSYGNKATPSINLRGFGGENGHQNVVITVDGQRLNNVDMSPQLLGAIPLANIERIEISKGSGSVVYGDGATAGAIQIYTKNKKGISVSTSFGNYGQQNHSVNAGISEQYIDLSVSLTHDGNDGFSKKDNTGYKDESSSDTQNVKLKIKPTDTLRFLVEGTSSRNDVRYPNSLTKAQFNENPRQSGGFEYTHLGLDSDQWHIAVEYDINEKLKASATHFREDKTSEYVTYGSTYNYDTEQNDFALSYIDDELSINGGIQTFDGERSKVASNNTSKDSDAVFIQTEYHPTWFTDALTVSAGIRHQNVKYRYAPVTGNILNASEHLNAWDIGANYRFNPTLTAFANINQSFEAPDVDRFFKFGGGFNGFIEPAKAKTLNIGLNHVQNNNHVKATVFYTKLNNEIYYFQDNTNFIYRNTNIDRSHKYGVELQDNFRFNAKLNTSLAYSYTRAIIDKENEGAGAYDGKNLPGVPKHSIVANLNYQFIDHAMLNLNHTWRARAYAYNDFANNASQRQAHYETTNATLSYQYKNMQFFTAVNNIFAHENSTQVGDDNIYPVDFARTWRVGMKADF